jgi:hypothetical protein
MLRRRSARLPQREAARPAEPPLARAHNLRSNLFIEPAIDKGADNATQDGRDPE